ncbi:hypothetical protein HELRODRAFT_184131 [Helobdella robusta]|uniref:Protein quiver n=1 Tax=Helobdella robusta TaxID=6412 RepID=T1FKM8_HELRO|nr:hypothetical protein HELRODRAFT_184131 [Helobdella robusta]ESO07453.1 hypothetical protein HELRODRAFT_184131 [Helobdella robusta]
MKSLQALVLLIWTFSCHKVLTLKCYDCDSRTNPNCGVPFNAAHLDTCVGAYCLKNVSWRGRGSTYPPPQSNVIAVVRACSSVWQNFQWGSPGLGNSKVQTCNDVDYCNKPQISWVQQYGSHSNKFLYFESGYDGGSFLKCYTCSGEACQHSLVNMDTCRGYSCYRKVVRGEGSKSDIVKSV